MPRPTAFPRSRRLKRRRLIRPLFERDRADVQRVRAGTVVLLTRTVPRADTGLDVGLQVGFARRSAATSARRSGCTSRPCSTASATVRTRSR